MMKCFRKLSMRGTKLGERRGSRAWRCVGLSLMLACIAFSAPNTLASIVITPTFLDGYWDGGTWVGSTESWTEARRGVVEQAIADWTSVLNSPDGLPKAFTIDFTLQNAGTAADDFAAAWRPQASAEAGADFLPWYMDPDPAPSFGVFHEIVFNTDLFTGANYIWFGLDEGALPGEAWDALTIARHEVGHALGYVDNFYRRDFGGPSEYFYWDEQLTWDGTDWVFDQSGLNVLMNADLAHVAAAGDLMNAGIVNGFRRNIESLHIDMLSLAYGYTAIPEPTTAALLGLSLWYIIAARRRKTSALS